MHRIVSIVCALLLAAFGTGVMAADPPAKLTPQERKARSGKLQELNTAGARAFSAGKYAEAIESFEAALELSRGLYPRDEFPNGHANLAVSLNNLAFLYDSQGKHAAEPLYKDGLEMQKKLFKGDHPAVATSLNNLAAFYQSQGKYTASEPLFKDALEMKRRLFKGDHPAVATSLNNLALLNASQGKYAAAEPLYKDALAMRQRLLKGDHPHLAQSLNNLADLYKSQGKYAAAEPLHKDALEMRKRLFKGDHPAVATSLSNLALLYATQKRHTAAEPLCKDALEMRKRLFKGDHPEVAASLNNLAALHQSQGKYAAAEPICKEALEMYRRLFKGDHPDVATSMDNLAALYQSQRKYPAAEPLYKDALEMYRRLTTRFAREKPEGEALTLFARLPLTRDAFLSNELDRHANPASVYSPIWFEKGAITRVYEFRLQQARAAAADPKAVRMLSELAEARRRRAELLLAPATRDPDTRNQRDREIKIHEDRIGQLTRELRPLLPAITRADRLAEAQPRELQKALPADAAVVDFLCFSRFEQDRDIPGKEGQKRTARYLAFVVTKEKIVWTALDSADKIEEAVKAWREAIIGGKEIAAALPAKVRELVWEKVRKELPATVKTVYLCPDAALCRLPFAALPGDKPGTILLEDYALATIPHATFLLDRLWPQEPPKIARTEALAVGGVKYDAEAITAAALRGESLLKPDSKLGWGFLPATVAEANGFLAAAERQKLPATRLESDRATTAALLAALPKARVAHLATHGFFADPSFRGLFQLDEMDYEKARWGERIGKAANSPLLMSGLVMAGANHAKTPGRGIVTGEALIDLDLSGLELAVLSACETGLGDVAGGEGTFALQRAFHLAGTHNVVASLWKVPDEPTAALMALFYRNLWEKKRSPMESLRQSQLELYRNPGQIAELAKSFRGKFVVVSGMGGEVALKPNRDGTTHPLLWAAFTLSGSGR